jgi:hypothetical protein
LIITPKNKNQKEFLPQVKIKDEMESSHIPSPTTESLFHNYITYHQKGIEIDK